MVQSVIQTPDDVVDFLVLQPGGNGVLQNR
jgi:hypothetical protein